MNVFTIPLKKDKTLPLYRQLYDYLALEIQTGRLSSGERLPSKKALSAHLKISRNTVETAYGMLVQEGYVSARPKSGYYVNRIDGLLPYPPPRASSPGAPQSAWRFDFRTNAVDLSSFPYKTWAKLNREVLLNGDGLLAAGDPRGDWALRTVLSKYLHAFRGVRCTPGQLVIGAGVEYLLTLLAGLFPPGTGFAVENPGYRKAAAVLENSGGTLFPLPLDDSGLLPDPLSGSGANAAFITPSHQFPTGIIMPIARRVQLLNWAAAAPGRYLIEDDYNSEFNFGGRPIPSVQSIDAYGKVVYMSTFSRTLAPSIRIAYMVLPPTLSEAFSKKFSGYSSTVSRFEQQTLCHFMEEGHFSRHINRVKLVYKKRREVLLHALAPLLQAKHLTVAGGSAGLHLLVRLSEGAAARAMENAARASIRVHRLSDYYFIGGEAAQSTLVLGYTGMNDEDLQAAVALLFSNVAP